MIQDVCRKHPITAGGFDPVPQQKTAERNAGICYIEKIGCWVR